MTGLLIDDRRLRPLVWALLATMVVLYAFPFVYLVLTSLKTPTEALAVPPVVLPSTFTLDNYGTALGRQGVVPSFINSLSTALVSTGLSLALAVPAAYGVTRFRTLTGRVFIMSSLFVRMIPPVALGVPLVGILGSLGLTDTPTGLAIGHTTISLPLSIWLMASFFQSVPNELAEAAYIDGCNRWEALRRVVLPVVAGGVAVTALFAFLASWNEFLFALLLTTVRAQTTPIAIANFQTQFGLDWGPMTALATVYSVPVVLLTLALQRYIVSGMTLGAVKG